MMPTTDATSELSHESTQARAMFDVGACHAHIDCRPCSSGMCREEQGEMPNRALCFAHECHRCASRLYDAVPALTVLAKELGRKTRAVHALAGDLADARIRIAELLDAQRIVQEIERDRSEMQGLADALRAASTDQGACVHCGEQVPDSPQACPGREYPGGPCDGAPS